MQKIQIKTECPECKKDFIREVYPESVIAGCALDLCPECQIKHTDEYGNFVFVINPWNNDE